MTFFRNFFPVTFFIHSIDITSCLTGEAMAKMQRVLHTRAHKFSFGVYKRVLISNNFDSQSIFLNYFLSVYILWGKVVDIINVVFC